MKPVPGVVYWFYVVVLGEPEYFRVEEEEKACEYAKKHGSRVQLI